MPVFRLAALLRRCLGAVFALACAAAAAQDCPPPAPRLTPELVQQARQAAVDRGLLWRAEKDGRVSWLYGTIHVGHSDWIVPGPRVASALAASDIIALELDVFDPAFAAAVSKPADPAVAGRVLTGETLAKYRAQVARTCAPEEVLAAQRPFMRTITLSLLDMRRDGLHPEFALEAVLAGASRQLRKPLVGLESPQQQLDALNPRSDAEEKEFVDSALESLASGEMRKYYSRMARAWAGGDEADLANFEAWCDCLGTQAERDMLHRLLDARNPGLADGIARLHAGGKSVFAGVGAMHYVGRGSVVQRLREKGFTVTRVHPAP